MLNGLTNEQSNDHSNRIELNGDKMSKIIREGKRDILNI